MAIYDNRRGRLELIVVVNSCGLFEPVQSVLTNFICQIKASGVRRMQTTRTHIVYVVLILPIKYLNMYERFVLYVNTAILLWIIMSFDLKKLPEDK